jgi:predicted DNA-binding mobile mystery protein A
MKNSKQWLLIEQVDKKLESARAFDLKISAPPKGWVNGIRTALKMSLQQLANRLDMTPQNVRSIEVREESGSITIKALRDVAQALDMRLVYAFVPKGRSLEEMIEKRAREMAKEIVERTSNTMMLEDQQNSYVRLQKAIRDKTEEIKNSIPKYLWD